MPNDEQPSGASLVADEPPRHDPAAAGWEPYHDEGFIGLVGPFWSRKSGERVEFAFMAQPKHHNRRDIVQGGMLMTFADRATGMTCWYANERQPQATAQLDMHFVEAVQIGDFVEAKCKVVRRTRALVFMSAELVVGTRVVATANGVWKTLGKPNNEHQPGTRDAGKPAARPPAFDPAAAGWTRSEDIGFVAMVGPIWARRAGDGEQYGFLAETKHHNRRGIVQGGMLMTFADRAMGRTSFHANERQPQATVQLDMHFVDAVQIGEFVEARCKVVRRTRALVFMSAELVVGTRVVAAANGVWKTLGKR